MCKLLPHINNTALTPISPGLGLALLHDVVDDAHAQPIRTRHVQRVAVHVLGAGDALFLQNIDVHGMRKCVRGMPLRGISVSWCTGEAVQPLDKWCAGCRREGPGTFSGWRYKCLAEAMR